MSAASPFVRKVRACAHERGIGEAIEPVSVNPHDRPPALVEANPLSKVPTLVAGDGAVFADSFAICLYLDTLGEGPAMVPLDGAGRWAVLQRHVLADGVLDAAVARRVESLKSEVPDRTEAMRRQAATIGRVLDRFERTVEDFAGTVAIDTVTLACGLAYLDFRFPDDGWREGRPRLARWHEAFEERPSMAATRYQG